MGAKESKGAAEEVSAAAATTTTTTTTATTATKGNSICENCVKSKQAEWPQAETNNDTAAAVCEEQYRAVDDCMKQNAGQISSCVDQWKAFQLCHADHKSSTTMSS